MSNNELLDYALQESHRVFNPLYLNDVFWLDHLKDNPNGYYAYIEQLMNDWELPDEDKKLVELDIQLYCPKPDEAHKK